MINTIVQAPNPADFSRDDKLGEYTAEIAVRGKISISIKAESREDAQRKAAAEVDRIEKEGYVEIDDIQDIDLRHMSEDRPMYRVTREGKPMQVSHLEPGDLPREPDQRGF